jgi:hypothetical protein
MTRCPRGLLAWMARSRERPAVTRKAFRSLHQVAARAGKTLGPRRPRELPTDSSGIDPPGDQPRTAGRGRNAQGTAFLWYRRRGSGPEVADLDPQVPVQLDGDSFLDEPVSARSLPPMVGGLQVFHIPPDLGGWAIPQVKTAQTYPAVRDVGIRRRRGYGVHVMEYASRASAGARDRTRESAAGETFIRVLVNTRPHASYFFTGGQPAIGLVQSPKPVC